MFCPNCRNELPDGSRFCGKCGYSIENENKVTPETTNYNHTDFQDKKTDYANTSFWCSIVAIPLYCCCIGLFMGIPATIFGALAIKNKEPNTAKAWIGLILGMIEVIFLLIIIWAGIRDSI